MVFLPEQDEHLGRFLSHRRWLAVHVWQSVLANAREFVRGTDEGGGITSGYEIWQTALTVEVVIEHAMKRGPRLSEVEKICEL